MVTGSQAGTPSKDMIRTCRATAELSSCTASVRILQSCEHAVCGGCESPAHLCDEDGALGCVLLVEGEHLFEGVVADDVTAPLPCQCVVDTDLLWSEEACAWSTSMAAAVSLHALL